MTLNVHCRPVARLPTAHRTNPCITSVLTRKHNLRTAQLDLSNTTTVCEAHSPTSFAQQVL